jgi:NAD(P)-dependent dehydrogenase (short-subunit alcohol dehydrogenase family)
MSVAVVTGAARGLGRGIAWALAEAGFDVVVGFHASGEEAATLVAELTALGRRAVAVAGDVADPATAVALADAAEAVGPLEVWVNNAGVSVLAPLVDTTADELEWQTRINLFGTFHGLQEAARRMIAAGAGGRIVNIASGGG